MDEGGELPVTGDASETDSHVTDNQTVDEVALKEAADTFLITVPPRERRSARKLLYKFIGKI